ncbi:MAG TPA: nucleotide kinase domain-containing protein, partial [Terriglobia bacterium]|nr:nucleotide kinase domain-containing protein [Terriglobia bacterium]
QLYVFEGPDGVGKTELSTRFTLILRERGVSAMRLSFPGQDEGTIGKVVYDLHHAPESFGVTMVAPSSLQLLHIAAHVDAIERIIIPALRAGTSVVLDRFWWSTKVYGLAAGSNKRLLDNMIDVELAAWGSVSPACVFLIQREMPLRQESESEWRKWAELYERVSAEEKRRARITAIDNNSSIEDAVRQLRLALENAGGHKPEMDACQMALELSSSAPRNAPSVPSVFRGLSPAIPTVVYDTYWRFAAERQEIFFRRWKRQPPPWTSDPVLSEFKFTNAYRASDRVSQFLIRNVIYEGDPSEEEVFFRIILFKLFNKVETWQLLERAFGAVTYKDFSFKAYDAVLSKAINSGETIYSAAYIMPSGSKAFGTTRKHRSHLKLLQQMMEDEVALRIAQTKGMVEAFTLLRSYPMIGDFLAYQYVTDLNYSTLTNFSETQFVIPGPGAKGGISKCFESLGGLTEADLIRVVTERQEAEFERLGIEFKSLWGRPLQLIDCQNLFCEVDKYSRVHHPDIAGTSLRTRIKQKFRASPSPVDYWYPPKWGLNEAIATEDERPGAKGSRILW